MPQKTNTSTGSNPLSHVTFKKQGFEQKHFSAFDEVFRLLLKGYEEDLNINPVLNPEAQIDPEDPESSIGLEYLINRSIELYKVYLRQLENFHSKDFARAYMFGMKNEDRDSYAINHAYESLPNIQTLGFHNPRYAEAFNWSLRSGKGETYANYFSNALVNQDCTFAEDGAEMAKRYADGVQMCLKSGHSLLYAHAYAGQVSGDNGGPFYAHLFANFYEKLIEMGYSHDEAFTWSDEYTTQYSKGSEYLADFDVCEVLKILDEIKGKKSRPK